MLGWRLIEYSWVGDFSPYQSTAHSAYRTRQALGILFRPLSGMTKSSAVCLTRENFRELRSISDNHRLPITAKHHALWEPRNSTVYPQHPVFWHIFVIKESKRSMTRLPHTNLSPQPGINQLKHHNPTSSCHILSI